MTQSAVRIAPILFICAACATTPAAARPGGGGHFGGGGGMRAFAAPHFSAPHFSRPSFAPRISAPHFSTPRIAPHVAIPRVSSPRISVPNTAHNMRIQSTARVAAQPFARPAHLSQPHSARPMAGAAKHIAMPTNQATRAFALAGVHRPGSSQVIRNPFFANRAALAHATFHGRFAQFPWRHHRRFGSIIVVGFIGPLFWPYAYNDFLDYTFYPYAYDAFWPYAYDDVYEGIIGVYGSALGPAYAGSGTGSGYAATTGRPQQPSSGIASHVCTGETAGVTDWRINDIAQTVEPDDVQRAALDELGTAMAKALDILKAACPTDLPSTPTGRIEAMRVRLSAMLEAVRTVRPPLVKFYGLLNDEQKARFNTLPSGQDQNEPERRRDLAELCSERASGITSLPIERMERAVQPEQAQRALFRDLRDAVARAGELLKTDCPTFRPITPVVRIDAMERRLDAMLRAVNTVQPALLKFYGSLTDEQKEHFNRLTPAQS
jgi:LTXXQ motif family protein